MLKGVLLLEKALFQAVFKVKKWLILHFLIFA